MIFENKNYETMGEIFSLANSLAKEGIKSKCEHFLIAYVTSILDENESVTNYEDALNIAKSNLGYFAGYLIVKLMNVLIEHMVLFTRYSKLIHLRLLLKKYIALV